jgi:hypothetical protein
LTYAALLWWKKALQISVNRKTAHLQRLAFKIITGSMHSTSTAALKVILVLPSLGIYIEGLARQTEMFCKIYSSKIWPFGGFRKDD